MGSGMQEGKMYEKPTTAFMLGYSLNWLGRRLNAEICLSPPQDNRTTTTPKLLHTIPSGGFQQQLKTKGLPKLSLSRILLRCKVVGRRGEKDGVLAGSGGGGRRKPSTLRQVKGQSQLYCVETAATGTIQGPGQ